MALRRTHIRLGANCLHIRPSSHRTTPITSALTIGLQCRHKSNRFLIAPPGQQAAPLRGYYAEILSHPLHSRRAAPPTTSKAETEHRPSQEQTNTPSPPSATPTTPNQTSAADTIPGPTPQPNASSTTAKEETQAKAQIVFGSRLAGPVERHAARKAGSREVAGVTIPPRPVEPDNCCMSGCVNCVWDVYREDLEEWALASREAKRRIKDMKTASGDKGKEADVGTDTEKEKQKAAAEKERRRLANAYAAVSSTSMDDDGGGSEALWSEEELGLGAAEDAPAAFNEDDLFKDIPVGIREFMRTEKKLKRMHAAEESSSSPPPP